MKYRLLLPCLIATVALLIGTAFALTPYEIAKKSLEYDKTPTKFTSYKMTVINKKGRTRVHEFTAHEKVYPDGSKKLIRFTKPADSNGIGLLSWEKTGSDDLQWLFLPSRKKARQLAAADKSDEFMGSDLFYEDMGTQSADDFTHELLRQVVLDGNQCYLVESKAKPGINSAYGKSRAWVDTTNFIPHKLELYGKDDKLIKTILAKKVEQVDGRWIITRMVAKSENRGKAQTEIQIVERQFNPEVSDRYFTKDFLENF